MYDLIPRQYQGELSLNPSLRGVCHVGRLLGALISVMATLFVVGVAPSMAASEPKVQVCHIPPGASKQYQTLTISASALPAHLAHGDLPGPCSSACGRLCDDHNLCTSDSGTWNATTGQCACTNTTVDCSDSNGCTADTCDPKLGCVNTPLKVGTACNDGELCTGNDQCDGAGHCGGTKVAGCCKTTADCSDNNLCTQDVCDPTTHTCSHPPTTTVQTCTPYNNCDVATCAPDDGKCTHVALDCNDNDPNTIDSCVLATGCVHTPTQTPGTTCTTDNQCASGLCRAPSAGGAKICVLSCTTQADCSSFPTSFCEATTAGAGSGYCVPPSPSHCAACSVDSDCGSLSERCIQTSADTAPACHVDCSLAGNAACPSDYTCADVADGLITRKLCVPQNGLPCLDALGGFCNSNSAPLDCSRTNVAGTCEGQRTCLLDSQRYDKCGAIAPQWKTDCSMLNPPGCTVTFAPSATSGVTNCGSCGNVCPGYQQPNDNVTCNAQQSCTFSCQGENYDVDNNSGTGCEVTDSPQGNHTSSTAFDLGSKSDCEETLSTFNGHIVSDGRTHEQPAVVGFNTTTGAAPDFAKVVGAGHTFCQNDIVATLTITGGHPTCYKLTVKTDKVTFTSATDGSGVATISHDTGGTFSDDTTITFEVEKTCGTSVQEDVSYTVEFHL